MSAPAEQKGAKTPADPPQKWLDGFFGAHPDANLEHARAAWDWEQQLGRSHDEFMRPRLRAGGASVPKQRGAP